MSHLLLGGGGGGVSRQGDNRSLKNHRKAMQNKFDESDKNGMELEFISHNAPSTSKSVSHRRVGPISSQTSTEKAKSPSSDVVIEIENDEKSPISDKRNGNQQQIDCDGSSEIGEEEAEQAMVGEAGPTETPSTFKRSPYEVEAEMLERSKQWSIQAKENEKKKYAKLERRHSAGNASSINHARLAALIRRQQRRRGRLPSQSIAVKYIQYFASFLYYIGMSPIKPASAKQLPKWFLWLQAGFYWTFAAFSILQAADDVKFCWLQFTYKEDLLNFITFGFFAANFISRIYYIIVFATSAKKTSDLIEKIDKVNRRGVTGKKGGWARVVAVGIGTVSMLIASTSTIFGGIAVSQWSFKKALLDRSYDMSTSLFMWSSDNYENTTRTLYNEYGSGNGGDLTPTTVWLAVIGNILCYCGTLHGCVLLDLWPITSIQIYILQHHFTNAMERTNHARRHAIGGRCPLSIHWNEYMRLRIVCDDFQKVFGKLLKLIHMQNILLYGYFLLQLLKKTPVSAELLIDVFSVIKVSVTYYLVQKSADKNEDYEECVIQCSGRRPTIEMNGVEMSVSVLLQDMKKHPVGVGRGDFFVNEAFVLKFVCAVGSIFMLLSGEQDV